jgi:hypothetical protein
LHTEDTVRTRLLGGEAVHGSTGATSVMAIRRTVHSKKTWVSSRSIWVQGPRSKYKVSSSRPSKAPSVVQPHLLSSALTIVQKQTLFPHGHLNCIPPALCFRFDRPSPIHCYRPNCCSMHVRRGRHYNHACKSLDVGCGSSSVLDFVLIASGSRTPLPFLS